MYVKSIRLSGAITRSADVARTIAFVSLNAILKLFVLHRVIIVACCPIGTSIIVSTLVVEVRSLLPERTFCRNDSIVTHEASIESADAIHIPYSVFICAKSITETFSVGVNINWIVLSI